MELICVGIGLTAFLAVHVYYLQEMIAALAMFSVLFTTVGAVVFILWLVDLATERILGLALSSLGRFLHWIVGEVHAPPV